MIKNFRKAVTFIGLSVVITIMAVTPAFAIDYTFENSLTSLAQIGADGNTSFVSPDKGINDTYWGELESKTITNVEHNTYYGVFPKYVLNPGETALQELGIGSSGQGSAGYFPSSGITETVAGMQIVDPIAFYRLDYLVGEDTYAPPHTDLKATDPIPNRVNPFGFKEADLLTQAEIKDSRKLTVFGDIQKTGSSNSTEVGQYRQGESLNLDFTMNASWFKRFIMGHTLDFTRTGYMSDQEIQKFYNETKGMFDSQIVYTVDIPKEVTVNNPSAVLTGLDGFDVTTEVKNNGNSKTLVVSARLNSAKQAKPELWKNTIEKLKKLDTSNVKMSVSGLSVSSSASLDSTVTLKGTVAGYFEWALSGNSDFSAGNPDASHTYLYFIAKQENAGRDAAAPQNKPNLISYTFKVNKAADNPVPNKPAKPVKSTKQNRLPRTGDNADWLLYAVLLGVSGAVLGGIGYRRRRKEN